MYTRNGRETLLRPFDIGDWTYYLFLSLLEVYIIPDCDIYSIGCCAIIDISIIIMD